MRELVDRNEQSMFINKGGVMKKVASIKITKICAFCINWYDLCNSNLRPVNTVAGLWEYEHNTKCKCLIRNADMYAWASCPKFKCKL